MVGISRKVGMDERGCRMTREQAIDILESRSVCMECVISKYDCDACDEAFKLAISALEQERVKTELNVELNELKPCEDAISRKAVIDAIRFGISNIRAFNDTTMVRFYERENEALEKAIDRVNKLPSVQPSRKGHWIQLDYQRGKFECSECHTQGYVDTCMYEPKWKYCPRCGAKMGEKNENE